MTTVRKRIMLLFMVTALAFLSAIVVWQSHETRKANLLAVRAQQEKHVFIEKLVNLKGVLLETIAFDYTFWDDMCKFVKTREPKWATDNLVPALSTYKIDGEWVYNTNFAPVYSTTKPEAKALSALPLTPDALRTLLGGQQRFCHFFLPTSRGLLEVRGATIHPSTDEKRVGRYAGFFLAGRLWDDARLKELAGLTDCRVLLQPTGSKGSAKDAEGDKNASIDFRMPLSGWDGAPVANLRFLGQSPVVGLLKASTGRAITLFVAFIALLMGLLFYCLLRWVSLPLKLTSRSLVAQNPAILSGLQHERTEFGELARLIEVFFEQKAALRRANDELEIRVQERTAALADAYNATIEGWSRAMELRDHETEGHCRRVTEMTMRLAEAMHLPEEERIHIWRGALLHDIGKMGVPDNILLKPGKLTDEEWVIMRQHTTYAYEMLAPIAFLRPALDIPYCHHEKWDGTGYPRGLKGEEIPLAARLFALADVWDALISDRPYRAGWPAEKVRDHIASQSGTHFDPAVVEVFLRTETDGITLQTASAPEAQPSLPKAA